MAVPYTFANSTSAIPLSQLDNNFATAITLGNTAIQLGNTVTTLNNMTMANVTISSVSTPITAAQGGTGLSAVGSSGNVLTSNGTAWVSQAPSAATGNVTIGNTTINLGGTATTVGNLTLTNATLSSLSTPVTVAQGGTGATTLTAENVLLGNGTSAVKFVAPGTSGNVLTSNGTTWASTAPAGGGALIFLTSLTVSNQATADITTGFSSTYDDYLLVISYLRPNTSGVNSMRLRFRFNGSYSVSNYPYMLIAQTSSSFNANPDTSGAAIFMTETISAGSDQMATGHIWLQGRNNNTFIRATGQLNYMTTTPTQAWSLFSGVENVNSSGFDGIRIFANTGNVTCLLRLYGYKTS